MANALTPEAMIRTARNLVANCYRCRMPVRIRALVVDQDQGSAVAVSSCQTCRRRTIGAVGPDYQTIETARF